MSKENVKEIISEQRKTDEQSVDNRGIYKKEDLFAAKELSKLGEKAIREAEESGDEVRMTRAEIARTFFLDKENVAIQDIPIDVAVMKQKEVALRKSEAELAALLGSMSDIVFKLNPNGVIEKYFQTANKDLYASPEAFIGKGLQEVLPPEASKVLINTIKKVVQSCESENADYSLGFPDGKGYATHWYNASISPIKNNTGEVISVTAVIRDITKRKQVENNLSASKKRYQQLFQSSKDAIMTLSPPGWHFELGNQSAIKMFGVKDEADFKSRPPWQYSPEYQPDGMPSAEKAKEMIMKAMKEGGNSFDWTHCTVDGKEFKANVLLTRVVIDGEEMLQATVRDITKQEEMKASLAQEREQLLTIFNNYGDFIYVSDTETYEILFANDVAKKTFSGKELVGEPCYKVLQGQDSPCDFCTNDKLQEDGEPYRWEYFNPTINRWFNLSDSLIQWPDGRKVRLEMASDITESRKADEKLKESEKKFRTLFELTSDAIFEVDLEDGRYLGANTAAERLTGRSVSELTTLTTSDITSSKEAEERIRKIEEADSKAIDFGEVTYSQPDGSEKTALLSYVVSQNNVFSIAHDITERKWLDEEMKRKDEQLQQSEKMRSLGTLAGGIVHDANNGIAAVLMFASLLKEDLKKIGRNDLIEDLDNITESSNQLRDLFKNLLSFAREESYTNEDVYVNDLIKGVKSLLERTIPKGIELKLLLDENLLFGQGDHSQFSHAIMNICINAIDAMKNEGTLLISTQNVDLEESQLGAYPDLKPGKHIQIKLSDNGPGMNKKTLKRCLDPFFTTKDIEKGTGLGLSMVYRTVVNHGGVVTVDSKLKKGTTVTILIPAFADPLVVLPTASMDGGVEVMHGTGTVLIVDDEEPLRRVFERSLIKCGYQVLTAENGQEAIEIYDKNKDEIVLVVMDLMMPVMHGDKAFYELKKLDPDVRVLISSGFNKSGKINDLLDAGVKGFIEKPFSKNTFLELIAEHKKPVSE